MVSQRGEGGGLKGPLDHRLDDRAKVDIIAGRAP